MPEEINKEVDLLVKRILKDYDGGRDIDKTDFYDRPGREAVHNINILGNFVLSHVVEYVFLDILMNLFL